MAYTTIDDPSKYFQSKAFTGNGTDSTAYTFDGNSDLQPDLLWFKSRSASGHHQLIDSTRGVNTWIGTSDTGAEATNPSEGYLDSLDSDGWTSADGSSGTHPNRNNNQNTVTYVAWGWKANGGTTASNSTGDITTTVQTDSTSGFSIITYTGNNTDNQTIGHGLGAVPGFAVFKSRAGAVAGTGNWVTHHQSFSGTEYQFVTTAAKASTNNNFKSSPTNSIFTLGNSDVNESEDIVCYAWAPIQGFSKFGTYEGNGNADGPFVYTGFKPAFVIIKNIDGTGDEWVMLTGKIATGTNSNPLTDALYANTTGAETGTYTLDFLSNGFKIRHTSGATNTADETYSYMAWAEQPFVSSKGVPCTAR